jgi:hypothetical protein
VFDELGYRRYEWKCDHLNTPSRAAALRFGFQYEGLFRQAVCPQSDRGCEVSRSAAKILNRIDEMWFNSSPMRELRAISFVRRLIDNSKIREGMLRKILSHSNFRRPRGRQAGRRKQAECELEGLHDLGSKSVDA